MAENTNIPNGQNRPSNANSGNNIPPRPQNMGDRPNIPSGQNVPLRPNISTGSSVPSRPNTPSGQNIQQRPSVPPRPNIPPRPGINPQRPINYGAAGGVPRPANMSNGNTSQRPVGLGSNIQRPLNSIRSNNMQRPLNSSAGQSRPTGLVNDRMSAGEKFERSNRSISHMSGGASGAKLYRINKPNEDELARRKVGGIVLDTDLIDDANQLKLANSKDKRKTAIIIILSMMLALSVVYLIIAIAGYVRNGADANCRYTISGDVPAHWIIDNNAETEFVVREGLASDSIYKIESILVIDTTDKVSIKISIIAKVEGLTIFIPGLDESANNMMRVDGQNTWIYVGGHQGGGEVYLFAGIDFYGAPVNINSANVDITVNAEIVKV